MNTKVRLVLAKYKKIVIATLFGGLILLAGIVLIRPHSGVVPLNEARHSKHIINLFTTDRYWLTADQNFSPEFMLQYKAPKMNIASIGTLHIKVLEDQGQFVGFVAYHPEQPPVGRILFLAIKKEYRGKHLGEKLLHDAIEQLKAMGLSRIILTTRVENYSAQKLYTRVGFREISRDDTYIHYELS